MQYWLNTSDVDAESFIKKFTLIPLDEINDLIAQHREAPEKRLLQNTLAKYMTCLVHSEEDYNKAVEASNILFGKGTTEQLASIDEETLLAVMKDVSKVEVPRSVFEDTDVPSLELAVLHDKVTSKSEARKLIKSNGFSINKVKVGEKDAFGASNLIDGKYLLLTKGKKDHCLVVTRN
jgi:tyrosyl-tRNA synthetase